MYLLFDATRERFAKYLCIWKDFICDREASVLTKKYILRYYVLLYNVLQCLSFYRTLSTFSFSLVKNTLHVFTSNQFFASLFKFCLHLNYCCHQFCFFLFFFLLKIIPSTLVIVFFISCFEFKIKWTWGAVVSVTCSRVWRFEFESQMSQSMLQ